MTTRVEDLLYPLRRYRGEFNLENLVLNANLQEFAQRVSYISNLATSGKLSTEESYQRLEHLWKQVERIKEGRD